MRRFLTVGWVLLLLAIIAGAFLIGWRIAGLTGIKAVGGAIIFLLAVLSTIVCWVSLYWKRNWRLAALLAPFLVWLLLFLAYELFIDDFHDTPGAHWWTNAWGFWLVWRWWGLALHVIALIGLVVSSLLLERRRRASGVILGWFVVLPMVVMTAVSYFSWDGWYVVLDSTPQEERAAFHEIVPAAECGAIDGRAIGCSTEAIAGATALHWFVMRESEVATCDPTAADDERSCEPANSRLDTVNHLDPEMPLDPGTYVVFFWGENKHEDITNLYQSDPIELTGATAAAAAASASATPAGCPGGHTVDQPERGGDGSLNAAGIIQRGPGTEAPTKEQVLAQAKVDPLTLLNWYVVTPLQTNPSFGGYAPLGDVSDAGQFVEGGEVVDGACYNQAGIDAYNRFVPVIRDLAHFSYQDVVTFQGANTGVSGDQVVQEDGVNQADESGYDVDYVNADGTSAGPSHSALSICSQVTTGIPTPGIPEGETTNEEVTTTTTTTTTTGKVANQHPSDAPDPADRGNGPPPSPGPGPVPTPSPTPESQVVEGPPPPEVSDPQGDAPVLTTPPAPPTDGPDGCGIDGNCG